jgi:N-acetyl-1-D-myo-inositol-2-amino-2-deoxy-alpha-D-glucopyranoside deacetylase
VDAKMAAVAAHATQIPTDSWLHMLSSGLGKQFLGVEFYQLVAGERGPAGDVNGWESDLFAGVR